MKRRCLGCNHEIPVLPSGELMGHALGADGAIMCGSPHMTGGNIGPRDWLYGPASWDGALRGNLPKYRGGR